jgi:DNA-directed RNA polymerase subunit E'/Rpb7
MGERTFADQLQIDAIVVSVNQHGFFAEAGPLRIFVSSHVGVL